MMTLNKTRRLEKIKFQQYIELLKRIKLEDMVQFRFISNFGFDLKFLNTIKISLQNDNLARFRQKLNEIQEDSLFSLYNYSFICHSLIQNESVNQDFHKNLLKFFYQRQPDVKDKFQTVPDKEIDSDEETMLRVKKLKEQQQALRNSKKMNNKCKDLVAPGQNQTQQSLQIPEQKIEIDSNDKFLFPTLPEKQTDRFEIEKRKVVNDEKKIKKNQDRKKRREKAKNNNNNNETPKNVEKYLVPPQDSLNSYIIQNSQKKKKNVENDDDFQTIGKDNFPQLEETSVNLTRYEKGKEEEFVIHKNKQKKNQQGVDAYELKQDETKTFEARESKDFPDLPYKPFEEEKKVEKDQFHLVKGKPINDSNNGKQLVEKGKNNNQFTFLENQEDVFKVTQSKKPKEHKKKQQTTLKDYQVNQDLDFPNLEPKEEPLGNEYNKQQSQKKNNNENNSALFQQDFPGLPIKQSKNSQKNKTEQKQQQQPTIAYKKPEFKPKSDFDFPDLVESGDSANKEQDDSKPQEKQQSQPQPQNLSDFPDLVLEIKKKKKKLDLHQIQNSKAWEFQKKPPAFTYESQDQSKKIQKTFEDFPSLEVKESKNSKSQRNEQEFGDFQEVCDDEEIARQLQIEEQKKVNKKPTNQKKKQQILGFY